MRKSGSAVATAAINKPPAYRVIILQCFLTIALVAVCYWLGGAIVAYSLMLGGLLVVLPNCYFAWRAFRYNLTRSAMQIVGGMVQAEIGKFVITALMFALVFKFVEPLSAGALFAGFMVVLAAGLIASAFVLPTR